MYVNTEESLEESAKPFNKIVIVFFVSRFEIFRKQLALTRGTVWYRSAGA